MRFTFGNWRRKGAALDLDQVPEPRTQNLANWLRAFKKTGEVFLYLLLAVVPGLSHAVQKRFGEVKLFVLAWLAGLILGLFFYGNFLGSILFWAAIALHAYIGIHASLWKTFPQSGVRVLAVVLAIVFIYFLYGWIGGVMMPDLRSGYIAINIPDQKIYAGDYLLGRASLAQQKVLPRGSVVLTKFSEITSERSSWGKTSGNMYGEIIGLPGERVAIEGKTFYINGKPLDPGRYPVPDWMAVPGVSISLNDENYFVTTEYNTEGWEGVIGTERIREACMVFKSHIEARAFLLWSPIWRRGYLKEP